VNVIVGGAEDFIGVATSTRRPYACRATSGG
jgi:hypothetical protein